MTDHIPGSLTQEQIDKLLKRTLDGVAKLTAEASQNELALPALFRIATYVHGSVVEVPDLRMRAAQWHWASLADGERIRVS